MTSAGGDAIRGFYGTGDLLDRVRAALREAGRRLGPAEGDVLAPADAFHIRGRAATRELAEWAGIGPGDRVLDVGCGPGGTSRFLASRGSAVVGLDLTEEYARAGRVLASESGLDARVRFGAADAARLPVRSGAFDVVVTEHVGMNVPEAGTLRREVARVLRPGGRYAFHEVYAGGGGAPRYPVPWAADGSTSHLEEPGAAQGDLVAAGLRPERWVDRTADSAGFLERVRARIEEKGLPSLSIRLLLGPTTAEKVTNLLANLEEGRLTVIQGVARRAETG